MASEASDSRLGLIADDGQGCVATLTVSSDIVGRNSASTMVSKRCAVSVDGSRVAQQVH
jgi:hypothetical protein